MNKLSLKILFNSLMAFCMMISIISCANEDDICTSGEATPRIKIKFRNKITGNPKTLDSVYVNVDYGNGPIEVIARKQVTDSLLIPLRVDDATFTEIYVGLSKLGAKSKIKFNYTSKATYVSPACGIKKLYENVTSTLENATPVLQLDQTQNQIIDESKTHLYLLF